jgi:ribosome maturation factor RimP
MGGLIKKPAFFVTRHRKTDKELSMKNTPLEHKIIGIAEPVIKDLGFDLVLLEFKGGVLQILAEDPKTGNLGLDDCTAINKALSPLLEVEDPIAGAYTLEISSPGIDRPLVRAKDFEKFKGFEAKIELDEVMEGQKRFRGVLLGLDKDFVVILVDKVEHRLELASIKRRGLC